MNKYKSVAVFLFLMLSLTSCASTPDPTTRTETQRVTVPDYLTAGCRIPELRERTFGYIVEVHVPELYTTIHQCNADKREIRDSFGPESGDSNE